MPLPNPHTVRRVSSVHDSTGAQTGFKLAPPVDQRDDHRRSGHWRRSRHRANIAIMITSCLAAVACLLVDYLFMNDEPLAVFGIRFFAWIGLPGVAIVLFYLASLISKLFMVSVGSIFSHGSIIYEQCTQVYSTMIITVIYLFLLQWGVFKFWLSGSLNILLQGDFERVLQNVITTNQLLLLDAIDLCQIAYVLIICWILMSIGVAFIKRLSINEALSDDVEQVLLNRKVLGTLCCSTSADRQTLFAKWDSANESVSAVIDDVRNNPLRLPLIPESGSEPSRVNRWAYCEDDGVDVTSLAQMHVLAGQIRDKICSRERNITYRDWAALFNDDHTADDAWDLFFDSLNLSDANEVTDTSLMIALVKGYERHTLLQGKIRNFDSIFGIMKVMMAMIWSFAMIYVITSLRGENPTYMIVSLLAFFGSVTFAVSSSINYAVVSVIFILLKKPYQVGDFITISGSGYFVENIKLLSTTFRGTDNKCLIISNYSLSSMPIQNQQISSSAVVEWMTTVEIGTSQEQLSELRSRLLDYVKNNDHIWKPQIVFAVGDLTDKSLKIKVKAFHRLNWQQSAVISAHQHDIVEEFRRLHLLMNIAPGSPDPIYEVNAAAIAA